MLQMLELGPRGREQLVDQPRMVVHAAAGIQKQQHFYGVMPLGPGLDVDIAMLGAGADGAGQVQLLGGAVTRPLPQALQRHLDVAGAQFDRIVEVAELALVPDLDRAAVAAFVLADAHALGVVAVSAKGRGASGADPFAAALMAALLLGQSLAQAAHQLLKAAGAVDGGALLGRQEFLGQLFQPVAGNCCLMDQRLDGDLVEAGKRLGKGAVETVDMGFVLDQRGAGEVIEALGPPVGQPGLNAGQQVQIFPQAGGHPVPAQTVEKGPEHQPIRDRMMVTKMPSTARAMAWAAAYCSLSASLPPCLAARTQPIAAPRRRQAITIMPLGIAATRAAVEGDP